MAKRDVDSGELWLPPILAVPTVERPRLPLATTPARRPVLRDLLTLMASRERLWMSPRLRALSPSARVKLIDEMEKLGAQLAQM